MNNAITAATKTICLLGHPVAHSISPRIHNHAFETLGLPYVYVARDVISEDLQAAIINVRESMAGANVTIPHKEAALKHCDEISALSKATGTVNTLYMKDDRLCGTTTDPAGFYKALMSVSHNLGDDDAVILGSGGTARTLAAAMLLDKKCKSLTIAARSKEKAAALVSSLKNISGAIPVSHCVLETPESADVFARCSLLVNCTSAGMHPNVDETPVDKKYFHKGMTVFDVIYNPAETRFLREANETGCKTKNGLLMLLYQGLESFKYWTGVEVPDTLFNEDLLRSWIGV